MIVFPEQIDVMHSESDVSMKSPPKPDTSSDRGDEALTQTYHAVDSGGGAEDAVTSQSARLPAGTSREVVDCEGIQSDRQVGRGSASTKDIGFEDVANEVKVIKRVEHRLRNSHAVGPGMLDDCSKLVCELSKELALLHGLSQGIGVDSDCPRLRQQLQRSQLRACALAKNNSTSLVPLVRRKTSLTTEQVAKVEKLYRIYSGSLEYLLYIMRKIHSLLTRFHLNQEACLFIRTGITEPADICKTASIAHRTEECYLQRRGEGNSKDVLHAVEKGESTRMSGDIRSMQQLLYMVTNACDTHPWHVGEEVEEGQGGEGEEEGGQQQQDSRTRSMHFRLSIKRQPRKSGGGTSKASDEEKGKPPDAGTLTEPDVTHNPVTATCSRSQSQAKSKGRCACACLMLCGLKDKDEDSGDQRGDVVTADTTPDLDSAAGGPIHIVVTDCAGEVCPEESITALHQ